MDVIIRYILNYLNSANLNSNYNVSCWRFCVEQGGYFFQMVDKVKFFSLATENFSE